MIRAAIVGTGGIAGICHVPALRAAADRAVIVAGMDVDASRVKDFCAEHDIPAAERDGGPYASVVYQQRFGSAARHLRDLVRRGELGRPLVALCQTTWFRDAEYYAVPWRGRWSTEGACPAMGHGIHQMDLMLAVLGDWAEVRAMAGQLDRRVETEDVSMATVRFANGAMASVVNSVLSPREESHLRFDFAEATVELTHLYGYGNDDWTYTAARHVPDERAAAWRTPPPDVPSSHTAQLGTLLDAYERGERPETSGAGGRRVLEFIAALYKSAFTARPVRRGEIDATDPFYRSMNGDL